MQGRPAAGLFTMMAALAAVACGANQGAGSRSEVASATPSASPLSCPPATPTPSARAPIGATQALTVIPVRVLADVPVRAGVERLGLVTCVNVGVGQLTSIDIHARVPPMPAEAGVVRLLSGLTLAPAVPSSATVPRAGTYTLTFTANAAGTTALTYLPATCSLPPGVC